MTNEKLAVMIKTGRPELYGELWQNVKRLVYRVMERYFTMCPSRSAEPDDLLQAGFIAVCMAVKDYNPDKGLKFTSYLARHCQRQAHDLLGFRSKAQPLTGSLDEPLIGQEDITLLDTIEDVTAQTAFEDAEQSVFTEQLTGTLNECIDTLPLNQQEIIRHVFWGRETLKAIGDSFGTSGEYVRQQETLALRSLRHPRVSRKLRPFIFQDIAEREAYKGGGFSKFRDTGMSSVERALERIERMRAERYRDIGVEVPQAQEGRAVEG